MDQPIQEEGYSLKNFPHDQLEIDDNNQITHRMN